TDALLLLLSVLQLWDHECDLQLDDQEPHLPTKKTNVVWELPAGFKHYTLARLTILGFYDTGSQGIVAFLGYLQPFPPSNSPQTYYLLYFTTSLQKIPPPITPSLQPFPSYLFPLYTITHSLTIYLSFL